MEPAYRDILSLRPPPDDPTAEDPRLPRRRGRRQPAEPGPPDGLLDELLEAVQILVGRINRLEDQALLAAAQSELNRRKIAALETALLTRPEPRHETDATPGGGSDLPAPRSP